MLVHLHSEQRRAGATVLAFPRLPSPQSRIMGGRPAVAALPDQKVPAWVSALNRPVAVFREIVWAMAIPVGMMLVLRIAFTVFSGP